MVQDIPWFLGFGLAICIVGLLLLRPPYENSLHYKQKMDKAKKAEGEKTAPPVVTITIPVSSGAVQETKGNTKK